MRGTIEVYDPADPDALIVNETTDPVLEALIAREVDIDAPHEAATVPAQRPKASMGAGVAAQLGSELPAGLADPNWRRSHSPAAAWASLVETGLEADEAWDAVAYLWLANVDASRLQAAATLYAKNCAACHGETGDGRGPGAQALSAQGVGRDSAMEMTKEATAFADPRTMLGGTSEIYYAKLRRGGMGTGMPGYGAIFTPAETWTVVDYLWTFVFDD
jgi:mono/diheme cytochrome c family protein